MKHYYYHKRLGTLMNILTISCTGLVKIVGELGARQFISFVRGTISGPRLDPVWVKKRFVEITFNFD